MLAVKAENISKQYRLGQVGTGTLTHDLNRFWHKVRGKENPYLKIGEANDRSSKGSSDYVWSLQDINFEIEQGDAVGIIGRNGAGKSTLLKILSKVTKPTTGKIYTNGRIASLLEVGTGFHPEMTGRENVFLNGAILGMSRKEIKRKFDEIVDFSGVERYIDTPVKRYSSGMYVRLAFAVAAHLESEILIIDEVLAVGDAEFQKKCLAKMNDVARGEGRTILFVSHNLSSVASLCPKSIFLEKGTIKNFGTSETVIDEYLRNEQNGIGEIINKKELVSNQKLRIESARLLNNQFEVTDEIDNSKVAMLEINYSIHKPGIGYDISVTIEHLNYGPILTTCMKDANINEFVDHTQEVGNYRTRIKLPVHYFRGGNYTLKVSAAIPNKEILDVLESELLFRIVDRNSPIFKTGEGRQGIIVPILHWENTF